MGFFLEVSLVKQSMGDTSVWKYVWSREVKEKGVLSVFFTMSLVVRDALVSVTTSVNSKPFFAMGECGGLIERQEKEEKEYSTMGPNGSLGKGNPLRPQGKGDLELLQRLSEDPAPGPARDASEAVLWEGPLRSKLRKDQRNSTTNWTGSI